ncbi:AraC family transcriptional regulator [Arenibacter sp. GZD96]|uniref:helix-turn-helix domain-containing protein n=1 Tax=Aurantibrevibacter litoralis TaxID=3106030 RepID=UPI002AFE823F|nr:AraC family transcriptional regulator [Arenibacter sp. GZD-96]MEA1785455.1 AraC family transcriptional regulator [Arenibacter sp. GZD-96]
MKYLSFENKKYGFDLAMDLIPLKNPPCNYFIDEIHATNFFEIFLFDAVHEGFFQFDEHKIEISPHSVFFISPNQRKLCGINPDGLSGYHLIFQNEFLTDFFQDKLFVYKLRYFHNPFIRPNLTLPADEFAFVEIILTKIYSEVVNFRKNSRHIIRALLYYLLVKLNEDFEFQYQLTSEGYGESVFFEFLFTLERHLKQQHDVQFYAQSLHISTSKLNALVKNQFKMGAKAFILHRLSQEIKIELANTDKIINEIAEEFHFSEPNNLSRFFKKTFGISPERYRASLKSDSIKT